MNDNVATEDDRLIESLRLLWDLYFLLRQLESVNQCLIDLESGIQVECDWGYWADRCAENLEFNVPRHLIN
jgi:hypothetical protein